MIDRSIAAAADYADALLVARRAKSALFAILCLTLLSQITLFLLARYRIDITNPSFHNGLLHYLVRISVFVGAVTPVILGIVLLLIVGIMLVGRLIGVARLTQAFLWCVVLTALLFPWQAFLFNQTLASDDFKIPGVIFTWHELLIRAREHTDHFDFHWATLFWGRFIGWPVLSIVILFNIQVNSGRGLRQALGESPVQSTDANADKSA